MIIFCKTYRKDFTRIETLLDSINKHNLDNIPIALCVDFKYFDYFNSLMDTTRYDIYTDRGLMEQAIINKDYEPRKLIRTLNKWEIQQIVKFEFCKNMPQDNCLIVDSDGQFIKDFREKDFFDENKNLYTVMSTVEERCREYADDLADDMFNYKDAKTFMSAIREEVQKQFKRKGEVYEFGPPPVLWSKKVVNDFYDNYLIPNKKSFVDIIETVPIEYNWYGEWLLKSKCIPLIPIEPMFKNITSREQYDNLIERCITKNKLSEKYFGINMQSNWAESLWSIDAQRSEGLHEYEL